jgi:hypothetical protein
MSRLTHPRRWAVQSKRNKLAPMTEDGITPDEARSAVHAIVMQTGCTLERVHEYDPRSDRFQVVARREVDNKLMDVEIPGETVARVVRAGRLMAGRGLKALKRPSELRRPSGQ